MVWRSYIVKIKNGRNTTINEEKAKKVYFVFYGVIFLSVKNGENRKMKSYLFRIYFFFEKYTFFLKKVYREN
jgi:hypothetical protein